MKGYYSSIAEGYEELYGEEQREKLKEIKKKIKDNGLTLDIGSGTGISLEFFKNIIQLDPEMGLLKKSRGMRVCGIAEQMPFKDHVFDNVISTTSLHHTEIDKAIKEIKRVAKPNTAFCFSILKKAKNFETITEKLKEKLKLEEENSKKDLILFKHVE